MNLHEAVRSGDIAAVRRFISQGVNLDQKEEGNEYGWTPLQLAKDSSMVELLLTSGANPNATNKVNETALVQARGNLSESDSAKNLEVVRLLLSKGAEVNAQTESGATALFLSVLDYQVELAKLLLTSGADTELKDNLGRTPLHVLVYQYSQTKDPTKGYHSSTDNEFYYSKLREILDAFLARGANVNSRDNEGNSPLHTAAKYDCLEMVQILVQRGATLDAANNVGTTAYNMALQKGHTKVPEFLESKGATTRDTTDRVLIANQQAVKQAEAERIFNQDAVQCPGCHKRFIWNQAFKQQDTPGSYFRNPPGHGDFLPRVFCPHCGLMVAEWDIDRSQDHNRWKWHGDFGRLNRGKPFPPSPLLLWGKPIHPQARSQPEQARIDIALNRRLWDKESKPTTLQEREDARSDHLKTVARRSAEKTVTRKERKRHERIVQERLVSRQCVNCGKALGLLDRLLRRTNHRNCQVFSE